MDITKIPSPCYVLDETKLRRNLDLIRSVKERSGADIILAFKAFALWKAFPIIREYITRSTASSVSEAQLAFEEMHSKAHTFTPAYTDCDFPLFLKYSSHITFNSLSQYERYYPYIKKYPGKISCGLRINPQYSDVETDLYNPCAPGSRLGIIRKNLGDTLPEGVEGLHFHTLCESTSYDLEKTLQKIEEQFGTLLPRIKWLNMGGGHLITAEKYDPEHLVTLLKNFRSRYPGLKLILEPGSAFVWQTGILRSKVVDIVENENIKTAILDVSFACHMPDCLEMPYKPVIRNAVEPQPGKPVYRMGGNSCLSGDFVGDWTFDEPLKIGDDIIFEDMMHYTTVKTTMFNGISHPSIALWTKEGELKIYRKYSYEDYKNRMC